MQQELFLLISAARSPAHLVQRRRVIARVPQQESHVAVQRRFPEVELGFRYDLRVHDSESGPRPDVLLESFSRSMVEPHHSVMRICTAEEPA